MFLIGLTGGIASGKSTVAEMFAEHGLPIIDADIMARKVVEPGKKSWKKLKAEFGDGIMLEDGTLNREKLAEVIFNDRQKRRRLNEITHPEIIKEMIYAAIKLALKGHYSAVMDVPLLYESGELIRLMHKVIVVRCDGDQQVSRLLSRTKMTKDQAELRVTAQMPLDKKAAMADYVIDNSGDIDETRMQADRIVQDIRRSKFHWKLRAYLVIGVSLVFVLAFFIISWYTSENTPV